MVIGDLGGGALCMWLLFFGGTDSLFLRTPEPPNHSNFIPCPQNPNHQGRYPLQTGLHCKRCVSPPHFIPSPTSSKKDTREGQEIRRKKVCRCKQEEKETRACRTGEEGEIAFEFPRACYEKVMGFACSAQRLRCELQFVP